MGVDGREWTKVGTGVLGVDEPDLSMDKVDVLLDS